jgi:hypothetical protein
MVHAKIRDCTLHGRCTLFVKPIAPIKNCHDCFDCRRPIHLADRAGTGQVQTASSSWQSDSFAAVKVLETPFALHSDSEQHYKVSLPYRRLVCALPEQVSGQLRSRDLGYKASTCGIGIVLSSSVAVHAFGCSRLNQADHR